MTLKGAALLAFIGTVLITAFLTWTFVAISDGASALLILLTAGLLLTFAIQSGLLLAPAF